MDGMDVLIGIFVFIFYALIKDQKDEKEPDSKDKKPKAPKPAPIPPRSRAKAGQRAVAIVSASSRIGNNQVVVNITNYPPDPASMSKQHLKTTGERETALRDDKFCPASGSAKDVTHKRHHLLKTTERACKEEKKIIEPYLLINI
jgi:hypothetical protein